MKFLQFFTLLALLMLFDPSAAANKRKVLVGKVRKFNRKFNQWKISPSGEVKKFCDIFGKLGFSHFHFFCRSTRRGRVGNACALSVFIFFLIDSIRIVKVYFCKRQQSSASFTKRCFLLMFSRFE